MIGALAVGITACMIAFTLYHARSGHPIPWKENKLFAVALDLRDDDPDRGFSRHPEYPPVQLTYQDARALYASDIPLRSVMMYRAEQVVTPDRQGVKPFAVDIRITSADFFKMFDVPFARGTGWSRADDEAPASVVVISRFMNAKLFRGENSVGRELVLGGRTYRVIGVLGAFMPRPKYYDMNNGTFDSAEDVYIPFGWMQALKLDSSGNTNCVSKRAKLVDFNSLLTADCVFLQYWVEFRTAADRDRFQIFVDNYTNDQRTHGRFPRKNNNWVVNVTQWLAMWDVVGDESRLQVGLGLVFLGLCILNTLGLMLAKFLSAAPTAGLRRALGATRMGIVRQHLLEVILVGILGGAVALILTLAGLAVLKRWLFYDTLGSDDPDRVALANAFVHVDLTVLLYGIALALLTGVLAGLYPAIRIGRLAPATFLKTQ